MPHGLVPRLHCLAFSHCVREELGGGVEPGNEARVSRDETFHPHTRRGLLSWKEISVMLIPSRWYSCFSRVKMCWGGRDGGREGGGEGRRDRGREGGREKEKVINVTHKGLTTHLPR